MARPLRRLCFAIALTGLAACGGDPAPTATTAPATATTPPPEQSDTTKLRAASAVGYDGAALQRSVDRVRAQAADQAKQADEAARDANAP